MRLFHSLALASLAVIFAACGGSGSSNDSIQNNATEKRTFLPTSGGELDTNEFDNREEDSLEEDSSETSSQCPSFIEGSPVGLACLHCGHPNAQTQAYVLAEILRSTCRRNIALTMLVDGTFSDDRDQLGEVIRRASAGGSTLHLYLYLSNGPWQRNYKNVSAKGIGTKMSPEDFRKRIQYDSGLRNTVIERLNWALPLISYAKTQGAVVYLIPMLEDNMNYNAARAFENLILANLPSHLSSALGRNPCPGCYSGNDQSVPAGLFEDQHIHSTGESIRVSGGLLTNDGATLRFADESKGSGEFSSAELLGVIAGALSQNNSFVIWTRKYQGLGSGGVSVDPDYREYSLPSTEEIYELLYLLQYTG